MQTFEVTLDLDTWTDVSRGHANVSFDLINADPMATVYYTDNGNVPDGDGNNIYSHNGDWDFLSSGMAPNQRVWIKGIGILRGVRG